MEGRWRINNKEFVFAATFGDVVDNVQQSRRRWWRSSLLSLSAVHYRQYQSIDIDSEQSISIDVRHYHQFNCNSWRIFFLVDQGNVHIDSTAFRIYADSIPAISSIYFFFLKKKCNELNQIVGAISPRRPLTPSALVNPPAKELRCQTFSIKHAPTRWPYHLDIEIYSRCKPTYAVSFFACSGGWSGLMLRNLVIAVLLHFNGTRSYVYQSRNCIKTVN